MTIAVLFTEFGMRGDSLIVRTIFIVVLSLFSLVSFGQNVLLLMNEETGEMVVIKKKQISDILTLNHEYLGNAIGISAQGIQSMRKEILVDSIHSLVVKNKNFGKALGFPFKVAGGGLGLLGGLLILASKDTKTDIRGNEETEYDPGQFIGGGLAVGVGISLFYLGNKMGDRKVEKEKTTYYLHKWSVKIVDRKNVGRYREAIEK